MLKKLTFILVLLVAALFLLVGCGSKESPTPTTGITEAPEPTVVVEATAEEVVTEEPTAVAEATVEEPTPEEPTEEPPTPEPTEEPPTPEPTESPPTPIPEIVDEDSACISCHTDGDRLKALAVEPEEVELSSGEG